MLLILPSFSEKHLNDRLVCLSYNREGVYDLSYELARLKDQLLYSDNGSLPNYVHEIRLISIRIGAIKLQYIPICHLISSNEAKHLIQLFPLMKAFLELVFCDNQQLSRRIRFDFLYVQKSCFQAEFDFWKE